MSENGDIERVENLVGRINGEARGEVEHALSVNREGMLSLAAQIAGNPGVHDPAAVCVAAVRRGEYEKRRRGMTTGNPAPVRIPAAEAFRRLYDAKASDLARYEMPVAQRRLFALDYACGEIHRCAIEPMPRGGVIELERALCAELGFDRHTGERVVSA